MKTRSKWDEEGASERNGCWDLMNCFTNRTKKIVDVFVLLRTLCAYGGIAGRYQALEM